MKINLLMILGLSFISAIVILVVYSLGNADFKEIASKKNPVDNSAVYGASLSKENFQAGENIEVAVKGISSERGEELGLEVKNADGKSVNARVEEEYADGELKFKVIPEAGLTPGKYSITVMDTSTGEEVFKQDFTWGVLAINTNKSIYLPAEKADIAIAVLDEEGNMVCDADVTLEIKAPDGQFLRLSSTQGTIKVNSECHIKAFTQKPDYEASVLTAGPGIYSMSLTAVTQNGTVSISDQFEVRNFVPFEIERISATRIFPPETYPVRVKIKANEDFSGKIVETVPSDFVISKLDENGVIGYDSESAGENSNLGSKTLNWNLSIKKGEEITIGYRYKSPERSPYFYTAGPLRLASGSNKIVFEETRRWHIAIDGIDFPRIVGRRTSSEDRGFGVVDTTSTAFLPDNSNIVGYMLFIAVGVGAAGNISWPSGWTEIAEGNSLFSGATSAMAYHIVTGNEGWDGTNDSITVTHAGGDIFNQSDFVARVWTFRFHSFTAPQAASATGVNASPDPPTLTPSFGSGKTLWMAIAVEDQGHIATGYPADFVQTGTIGIGAGVSLMWGERSLTTTSLNPTAFTTSHDDWIAWTVGFKEADIPDLILKGGVTIKGSTTLR